ncbi:MAG: RNA polymerase sigma factor (sigma-70 family) [Bacteroidia bacterium]
MPTTKTSISLKQFLKDKSCTELTAHLFRRESAKMTAVLVKIFGYSQMDFAEDVVQDTFSKALQNWSLNGIPDNPSAWLYKVAKHKALDIIRRNKFSESFDFSGNDRDLLNSSYSMSYAMDTLWNENTIDYDLLRMMFACCHDGISTENQITLILKTLCGFNTKEVASALLVSEDTISKRLVRVKKFFRDKNIKPAFPGENQLKPMVRTLLTAIYLIFNEGYHASQHDIKIRKDLLNQSMFLCKMLIENPLTAFSEVYAALALMCFHASRIDSRVSEKGDVILLANQDRTLWSKELIDHGLYYMSQAAIEPYVTSYHFEAAIAYEHCSSATFESTNWVRILSYYDGLLAVHPSAVTALNRLIVFHQVNALKKTLEEIYVSKYKTEWESIPLFFSFLGDLYRPEDISKSKENYQIGLAKTNSQPEKNLIQLKIDALNSTTSF